ncbi:MAG: cobalamin-dependent protein [Deltaproteobacteria bacterium]|nr:cobalamin-dependent protein [Deltaproteobacteria bacterium]
MRVLLVHPFCPLEELPSPPLSIGYVAAALERAAIEVKVLDLAVEPYSFDRFEKLLREYDPSIVGATAVTMTFNEAIKVVIDAKTIAPEITTVMGGPHVSFCAEESMRQYPELDVVVIGEGDNTIVEVARAREYGKDFNGIAGIVYRDGSDIRRGEERPPSIDVNTLPFPARHLLPLSKYRALGAPITMTTSRGCPFQCIFCVGRKMVGSKVRYRNAQSVVDEFQYLNGLGFPQINIVDDLFTSKKEHCITICDEIMARGIKAKWTSFARAGTVSLEVLEKMKQAGCYAVSFGFESSDPEILRKAKKGITVKQMVEAVEMCVEVGLIPHGSFVLGLPGETPETMRRTIEFGDILDEMGAMVGCHLLAPFPGTQVREKSEEYGLEILTDDWSQYTANRAVVQTATAKKAMFDEYAIEVEQKVQKQYVEIKKRLDAGIASDEDRDRYAALERMGFFYRLMMNRALEQYGCWTNGQIFSTEGVLRTMADRIADSVSCSKERAYELLGYSIEKGILKYRIDGDKTLWEWATTFPGRNLSP